MIMANTSSKMLEKRISCKSQSVQTKRRTPLKISTNIPITQIYKEKKAQQEELGRNKMVKEAKLFKDKNVAEKYK